MVDLIDMTPDDFRAVIVELVAPALRNNRPDGNQQEDFEHGLQLYAFARVRYPGFTLPIRVGDGVRDASVYLPQPDAVQRRSAEQFIADAVREE